MVTPEHEKIIKDGVVVRILSIFYSLHFDDSLVFKFLGKGFLNLYYKLHLGLNSEFCLGCMTQACY